MKASKKQVIVTCPECKADLLNYFHEIALKIPGPATVYDLMCVTPGCNAKFAFKKELTSKDRSKTTKSIVMAAKIENWEGTSDMPSGISYDLRLNDKADDEIKIIFI